MVEITYQMVLSTLQTLALVVGIVYYITIMRNQQKTRELALKAQEQATETRQTQMFMQIYHQVSSKSFQRNWIELMNMEWDDYDDFERKYGSDNNPENFAMRSSIWMAMNGVGAMLLDGLIEPERLVRLVGQGSQFLWAKFKPIIYEQRVRYGMPNAYYYFEYLAETLEKELLRQNEDFKLPETLTRYIPDE